MARRVLRWKGLLGLIVLLVPSLCWGWGYIEGFVRDEAGLPINGARVTSSTGSVSTALADGSYFMGQAAGTYTLTATAEGYTSQSASVEVTDLATSRQDFNLAKSPLAIQSVTPNWGEMGTDLEVSIVRTGFNTNTRVVMSLDSGNTKKILGSVNASARSVTVIGSTAYVTGGNSGLQVIDVSDQAHPSIIGAVDTPGDAAGFTVVDSKAYVADGWRGLQVIDVSDSSQPTIIGSVDTQGGVAMDVTVIGSKAYVVNEMGSLNVIDVSNPAQPAIIGSVGLEGSGQAITVVGSKAYVVVSGGLSVGRLLVIDVSNSVHPVIIGSIETSDGPRDVTVVGSTAYVADYSSGLEVIDVSNPAQPTIIGSIDTPGWAIGVTVVGSTAYVADAICGLQVIDVSTPAQLKIIGSIDTPGTAWGVTIIGGTAYVADGSLLIIDVSAPTPLMFPVVDTPGYARDIKVVGSTAYVADFASGLQVIDVSDPARPTIIGGVDTPGFAQRVTVDGSTAYVSDWYDLKVIDLNPLSLNYLQIIGTIDTPGTAWGVTVVGSTAYVADGESGLQVIDISDPSRPVIIGSKDTNDTPGSAIDVMVVGSTAYVAGYKGLHVIDVSDPVHPSAIGDVNIPYARKISVVGNTAYVLDLNSLWVIDLNPLSLNYLKVIGRSGGLGDTKDFTVVGGTAYVVGEMSGLRMVDIGDPAHLGIISSVYIPEQTNAIAVDAGIAYVANEGAGLTILPVPMEIKPVTVVSDTELRVILPSPQLPGNYTLRLFDASQADELAGAVTFSGHVPKSKAIIVAGYGPEAGNWLWEETKRNTQMAYKSLLYQGYRKENIRFLSRQNLDADGDGMNDVSSDASLANLQAAITTWARDADEVLIYLVDHGGQESFEIKHSATGVELLTASQLDDWLDTLQSTMLGRVIVIIESCYSGSFVNPLKLAASPPRRIVLASSKADELTKFLLTGRLSFGYQFWAAVFDGANLPTAFNAGKVMMKAVQTAWLDGNGDGVANTYNEGDLSGVIFGRGYKSAPGAPTIFDVADAQNLSDGTTTASLWAGGVVSLNPVTRVWAVIVPPDYDPNGLDSAEEILPTVDLTYNATTRKYEGVYAGFTSYGEYKVAYYVMDDKDTISQPVASTVTQNAGADPYEPDDSPALAGTTTLNAAIAQQHTFQHVGDMDWLQFYALQGQDYAIEAQNLGPNNDVVIELYTAIDLDTPLDAAQVTGSPRSNESLDFHCSQSGIYYVKFFTVAGIYGPGTEYEVKIGRKYAPALGTVKGTILNSVTLKPVAGALVTSMDGATDITDAGGAYEICGEAGRQTMTIDNAGYGSKTEVVDIPASGEATVLIHLTPLDTPNRPPVAQAGPDIMAAGAVTLDGSGSIDPEGEAMTYDWRLVHREEVSATKSAGGVTPTVSGLLPGFYDVTLTVTDSQGLTASDTQVLLVAGGGLTQEQLDQAVNQAVATAEAAKDTIIGQKDQTITQLTEQVSDKEQTLAEKEQLLNRLCTSQDLKEGFNLVGFACPPEGYKAHQFLNALGASKVISIQRFNEIDGTFTSTAFDQNGQVVGYDFPLVPGQGYIVYMKQAVQGVQP